MMTHTGMTGRERVLAAFAHQDCDRLPAITPTSVATLESMKATGAYFPDVHTNADKMAALAAAGHDLLGFDTVTPYFSIHQEAAALGCDINWGKSDEFPTILRYPVQEPDDFVMPRDFLQRKPVLTVLRAIKILRRKYGDRVAIIGKVIGPWTLTYHLHGVNNVLLETILAPRKVHDFLQVLKQVPLTFAAAQFAAGADIITWADHATADLISAKGYEDFLFPVHRECNRLLRKGGPVIMHLCGEVTDRLGLISRTGFDAFHLDSRNDIRIARQLAGRMLLVGGVNNPVTLLNGNPAEVRRTTEALLDAGLRLVAPECAVPCHVPNENLWAIVETVRARIMR